MMEFARKVASVVAEGDDFFIPAPIPFMSPNFKQFCHCRRWFLQVLFIQILEFFLHTYF